MQVSVTRQENVTVMTVSREIRKEEESRYIEIPFDMPEGIEEIRVRYRVESRGEPNAVIDLGVRDGERVRGWSGGARSEFRLGLEKATPGYLPGPLTPGRWAVLHNAYRVPAGGCTVTVTVELHRRAPRWLKGDLHVHSVHSDGVYTPEENARILEELGCDFLAMTDHNTCSQNVAYPRMAHMDIVMIPGYEFTTNFGHINFLGVADPLDDFRVAGREDVHRRLRTARERGAKIVLNHPHCHFCPWLWGFDVDFDWVEIWNGPWTPANQATLEWWHAQLVAGRRLTAVGGSDMHRPDPYRRHAMPTTWVYSETKTADGILEGIGRGRVVLSYAPDGPFAELHCGSYGIGDGAPAGTGAREPVRMTAERVKAGDLIRLIDNRGVQLEVTAGQDGALALELPAAAGRTFCRAEIWRHFGEVNMQLLAAATNPVYLDGE